MKKLIKYVVYPLLGIIILANVLIIATGNQHLYKGIRYTYLVGKKGPGIDDLDKFPYRSIKAADHPFDWPSLPSRELSASAKVALDSFKTVAFVVIKRDTIIHESYYEDYNAAAVVNSFSMSKSVVGLLIGIALDEGKIGSLKDPVVQYLPEYSEQIDSSVAIEDLLHMASGIGFDENYTSPFAFPARGYYGNDLKKLVGEYRSAREPGTLWRYKGGDTQLLAFVIEKVTGMKLSDYATEKLWKPLGAEHDAFWSLDADGGEEKASCCLYADARDFARLGALALHEGLWQGRQIVPEAYMEQSFTPVNLPDEKGNLVNYYGYQWWMGDIDNTHILYARGILGQYIIAVPDWKMVIVRLGHERSKDKVGGVHPADIALYLKAAKELI